MIQDYLVYIQLQEPAGINTIEEILESILGPNACTVIRHFLYRKLYSFLAISSLILKRLQELYMGHRGC